MAALTVEHASLMLIGWGYGRAPPDLMVEHLKVLNSRAPTGPQHRNGEPLSLLVERAYAPYRSSP